MPWAIPVTLTLITLSVACLGVAMLAVLLGSDQPPFRLIGIGTWSGFGGLFLLFVFVIVNVIGDSASRPVIAAVRVSPMGVMPGQYVALDIEASDQSGEGLRYRWMFQGRAISSLRNGYLKAPAIPGTYPVTIQVSNERATVQSTVQIDVSPENAAGLCLSGTSSSHSDRREQHGSNRTEEGDSDEHAQRPGSSRSR
jgi:hypothetical protein